MFFFLLFVFIALYCFPPPHCEAQDGFDWHGVCLSVRGGRAMSIDSLFLRHATLVGVVEVLASEFEIKSIN